MRLLAALVLGLTLLAPRTLRAEAFPFTAYVRGDGTAARTGPGENFAATDHLDRGTEISVYRRDPGGWLAIRPPDGSFDWVEGSLLKLDDEGRTATATKSEVPVLVGSRLGALKTDGEWQVKLEKGEAVEILGKKQVGEELWYKVAPPAGEFRWLREQEISRQPPQPGDEPPPAAEKPAPQRHAKQGTPIDGAGIALLVDNETPVKADDKPAAAPMLLTPLTPPAGPPSTAAPPAAAPPIAAAPAAAPMILTPLVPGATAPATTPAAAPVAAAPGDGFVPRQKNGEPRVASLPAPANPVTLPPTALLPSSGIPAGNGPLPRSGGKVASDNDVILELADLDIDLALVVAQDPAQWRFETLRQRAEACIDTASAPPLRARAREMMQKVNEFDALRQRSGQLAALAASTPAKAPPPVAGALAPPAPAATVAAKAAPPAAAVAAAPLTAPAVIAPAATATAKPAALAAEKAKPMPPVATTTPAEKPATDTTAATAVKEKPAPEFDGEGWLMPVITRRKDVPPYALTDDDGKLVGFVTPMPGVNLDRYKKQKIGVKGTRGYIDEFNKPHVTAERVKVIEATKLR